MEQKRNKKELEDSILEQIQDEEDFKRIYKKKHGRDKLTRYKKRFT